MFPDLLPQPATQLRMESRTASVAIDDRGIRVLAPLTDASIKRPDGTFVRESFEESGY